MRASPSPPSLPSRTTLRSAGIDVVDTHPGAFVQAVADFFTEPEPLEEAGYKRGAAEA